MLLELQINDFAIIDRLHLRLGRDFNVLTGETGAGKSIIIDALGMLRGEKSDVSWVRSGSQRARVEGLFSLGQAPELPALLREHDLLDDDDDQVIIAREINAESGRSVARINGRAVNNATLREIGARLVDIHGQHEGLSLFDTRTHLDLLDRYGGLLPQREQVAAQVAKLRQVRDELNNLRKSAARRNERIEELRFLLEDVGAAKLRPAEADDLVRERALMQNGARITDLVAAAYAALYQGDEGGRAPTRPAVELLVDVDGHLADLARLDPSVQSISEQASDLRYRLEDLATAVRAYRDALDFDPARLDEIEDRLTLIRDLERKYGGSAVDLLERAAKSEAEIERLTHSEEHLAELEAQERAMREALGRVAGELSRRRRATSEALAQAIEGAMGDLAMPFVRFSVQINHRDDPNGAPTALDGENGGGPRLYAFDRTGVDQVEFMLSPNPGEPLKPLARIASGGESSRLLLALKSILSEVDTVPTLVFDEVDVGVGGRAGQVVGEKLWAMTGNHQVICITHLPQVAAFADAHYHIAKEFSADRTRTRIATLSSDQQVDELAAMLDGTPVSEHSRASAREMIGRAGVQKQRLAGRNGRAHTGEPALAAESRP
ncbi:MAG: DNA repair protein RecN [Chloroflexales bacterium]|nr:DNA repair protein RecN [Chloroflexales bacterium]